MRLETGRHIGEDVLVLDPTPTTAGLERSEDPVPRYCADAYRTSLTRRTGA